MQFKPFGKRFSKEIKIIHLSSKISEKKKMYYGYSETNKLINFSSEKILKAGEIVDVLITEAKTWSLDGRVL